MKKWLISYSFFWIFPLELSALIPEKVVICAICRDESPYLPEMISQIESIGSLFQDYRVVVYENNSEDDTPSQLYRWKRANPKVILFVEFIPDSELEKKKASRNNNQFTEEAQKALARNNTLSTALSQFSAEFSYILLIDANVKRQVLNELIDALQKNDTWNIDFLSIPGFYPLK